MGSLTKKQTGRGRATRNSPLSTPGDESPAPAAAAAECHMPPREGSRSRSSHRPRHSPADPKQGGPFKVIPFDPKEMRADAYVNNFEQAIRSYYKSDRITDYLQRQHFFEALSCQQRLAIGCVQMGETYEEMKKSFLAAYGKRQYSIRHPGRDAPDLNARGRDRQRLC